jgi:dihydrofolate synthase / folylpolyglutamate synthase
MSPPNDPPARASLAPGPDASLDQWLIYLESIHPAEIDLGLDRVLVVFRRLFRSNPSARILIIGGTNGKGSTVVALEKLLQSAGRTTGAYTSPHLQRYNERVRVNGMDVSDRVLVRAFETVEAARRSTSLTYFEFGTLAAFVIFQEAGVENWVLEVGLGGRLDAVNILDAQLAIITSVDIDHQAYLGNDIETIGFEKAGILRPGQTAIFADLDPPRSVLQQAGAQKVNLLRPGHGYQLLASPEPDSEVQGPAAIASDRWLAIDQDSTRIRLPDHGLPVYSLAAAVVAIRKLEPELSPALIESTLASLTLPGRFERLQESPTVVVDVGHNPHAARWLASRINGVRQPGQRVLAVYGALGDKDVESVVEAMSGQVDQWFFSALGVPRGLGCSELVKRAGQVNEKQIQGCFGSVEQALSSALAVCREKDLVLVFGSFFTVAAAREALL